MTNPTYIGTDASDSTGFSVSPSVELQLSPTARLLAVLLDGMVLLPEEWDDLPVSTRTGPMGIDRVDDLLPRLVDKQLLTKYQAEAVGKGRLADLVVGH